MSILSHKEIERRCRDSSNPLIEGFNPEMLQGASYDLTLGDEFYVYDKRLANKPVLTTHKLNDGESVNIPPGEVCYLITAETINMPQDLSGSISLTLGLIGQGLMLAKQPPIDPGYSGKIVCMLHNLSDREVYIPKGAHILTIEFFQLDQAAQRKYDGKYNKLTSLKRVIKRPITSGLHQLWEKSDSVLRRIETSIPVIIAALSVIIAVITAVWGAREIYRDYAASRATTVVDTQRLKDSLYITLSNGSIIKVNLKTSEVRLLNNGN